jgi:hypothetical protein
MPRLEGKRWKGIGWKQKACLRRKDLGRFSPFSGCEEIT